MIAVTGLGAVTALGANAGETWDRVVKGERAFKEVSLFPADGYRVRLVAEVPHLAPAPGERPDDFSRTSELAIGAAREALAHAQLDEVRAAARARGASARIGLVVGGSTAGLLDTESMLAVIRTADGSLDPKICAASRSMIAHPLSAPTDRIARELGPFSRVRTLSSACSSGANAIVVGATWLELGLVDAVLCGAADALCRVTLSGFNALGALDPEGARPFDRRRRGLTIGEGAGFVVLERAVDAAARGQDALCMLLGWAARAEAHHITNPEPSGDTPARAMTAALRMARLTPADIDYVNAHGTGTPLNDPMESRALVRVLGSELGRIAVSSQKGQIGHTLAASGAIEATITAHALARGIVPPSGGLEDPDPECPLTHVPRAVERPLRAALSSSFAFGGMDTVLVFGRAGEQSEDAASRRSPSPSRGPEAVAAVGSRRVVVTGASVLTPAGIFGGAEAARVPSAPCTGESLPPAILAELDPERARRLDRASRIAAVACRHALGADAHDAGVILGNAFGAVEATTAYVQRLREKGARLASPADFPSLVPSSPAGHVSIYLGLAGPTFSVADLSTSGECAFTQGYELVAAGDAERVAVVAVEEQSPIVDRVFRVIFAPSGDHPLRREGAGAVALAEESAAVGRGLPILASVASVVSWWQDDGASAAVAPPADAARACVVVGLASAETEAVANRAGWGTCRRIRCEDTAGSHEAVGAIAIAVAAATLSTDPSLDSALVVGVARGAGYAITLSRWTKGSSAGTS